jgi:hypothetical protein
MVSPARRLRDADPLGELADGNGRIMVVEGPSSILRQRCSGLVRRRAPAANLLITEQVLLPPLLLSLVEKVARDGGVHQKCWPR